MQGSAERKGPRRWTRRAALLALGFVVAFVLCEIGFRVAERVRLANAGELWAVYDETLGWRNNPLFPGHNPDGLRDRPVVSNEGCLRILMLGDSVLYYGLDADGTVVGHMRARLGERMKRNQAAGGPFVPFDVLNASVKGYTNWQEIGYLKTRGLGLLKERGPKLVGVGFVLNDCYRMLHRFRVEDGRIVGQDYDLSEEATGALPGWYRLLRRSQFLVWVRRRLAGVEPVPPGGFTFDVRPDFRNAWRDEPWAAIEAQMRELRALGEQHGFRPFVVVFPFGDQYREDYLARDRAYVLKPQRRLAGICAQLSIPCLDLYPLLDRAADVGEDGIHLTKAGREHTARLVVQFLFEEGLIPADLDHGR